MNIAELFVRLRGDTSDLDRKLSASERQLLRLHGSTGKLEGGMKSAGLQTGRLGNQFAGLAGQIAGVHPVVGNLAQVLGNFALNAGLTVGVLAGVAAIAVVYDQLTKATREARKEQDALISSLEKAIHLKGLGPGGETVDQTAAANKRAAALKTEIALLEKMIVKGALDADVMASNLVVEAKLAKLRIERQNALNTAAGGQSIVNEKINEAIKAQIPAVKKLKDTYMDLRDAIDKVRTAVEAEGMAFWTAHANRGAAMAETAKEIADLFAPNLDVNQGPGALKDFGTTISGVDTNIGLTKEQIKTRDELVGTLDKNTLTMRDAIWGAAAQSAGIIVNALNIGGGGKGSSLGGAIGGTAGFALGFAFGGGPIGGAIGATVGNIAGSLLGGLFDNKEAVNSNTSAVRALTQAMLLGAPSGFRIEPYRYGASTPVARNPGNTTVNIYGVTDAKEVARVVSKYATRGGAPLLAGT